MLPLLYRLNFFYFFYDFPCLRILKVVFLGRLNKTNKDISERFNDFNLKVLGEGAKAVPMIDPTIIQEFVDYWTEKNISGKKMKFEMQKTFDINLRLIRWNINNFNKNKSTSKIDYQISEYLKGKELL